MKVATWRGEARFTIDEVPDPAPGPGQVVVDINTAGICGTDIHATQGLDPVTAALTEPAACCLAGLEMFRMPPGATVLVIGGGLMGLLTMVLARRRGARRLILSDPLEERRSIARRLGAHIIVDPSPGGLRDRVMALTRGRGADVVCEAVGKPDLVAEAMRLVKPTGTVQLVGVSPLGSHLPLDLWDIHF